MKIRRRGKSWEVSLAVQGRRLRKSFKTEAEAPNYGVRMEAGGTLGLSA